MSDSMERARQAAAKALLLILLAATGYGCILIAHAVIN